MNGDRVTCDEAQDWIWGARLSEEEPPPQVAAHLARCEGCQAERTARRVIGRQLRGIRGFHDADPAPDLDEQVLEAAHMAVAARETRSFLVEVDPDVQAVSDGVDAELVASIQAEIDADLPTTGRVSIRAEDLDALRQRPDWGQPRQRREWQPPRASVTWMMAATLLLGATLALGFSMGRATATPQLVAPTLTADGQIRLQPRPRLHSVGLDREGLETLRDGNTYLLNGPVGGPYEVVGVVNWNESVLHSAMPASDSSEIVVAVGPAGGWSRGKQLAWNDLSQPEVEILGRRAVAAR